VKRVAEGVYVAASRYWQLNTGVVTASGHAIVVDAGVFPDELSVLAQDLREFQVEAGVVTHEHWDHVLWSAQLGATVARLASVSAARAAIEQRPALLTRVAAEQDAHGVSWDQNLIARVQPIPFGEIFLAGPTVELCDLAGHTPGHAGVWVPGARVAFVGDTVSDVDPPALSGTPAGALQYVQTLDRLQELIAAAEVVVPGHGTVCDRQEAQRRLDADARYLDVVLTAAHERHDSPVGVLAEETSIVLVDPRLAVATGWGIHLENLSGLLAGTQRP